MVRIITIIYVIKAVTSVSKEISIEKIRRPYKTESSIYSLKRLSKSVKKEKKNVLLNPI